MKCVFREEGYVPKEHLCVSGCQPLEKIFYAAGLSKNDAKKASKNVLKSYAIIGIDDILRDQKPTKYQNFTLNAQKAVLGLSLNDELKSYLRNLNKEINHLESKNAILENYLQGVGFAGRDIFVHCLPTRKDVDLDFVRKAGMILAEGTNLTDMVKDLNLDIKNNSYNPLKSEQSCGYIAETRQKLKELVQQSNIKIEKDTSLKYSILAKAAAITPILAAANNSTGTYGNLCSSPECTAASLICSGTCAAICCSASSSCGPTTTEKSDTTSMIDKVKKD